MSRRIYSTESGSTTSWLASIDERQITEPVVHNNPSSTMNFLLKFNFQTINCWVNYNSDYEVLRQDAGPLTSRFTWVDFGEAYDDLKHDLLSKLANCGSQSFKEEIVDALISYGHALSCTDEKKMFDIYMTKFVSHRVVETSLGSNDGLNMIPASMDAIISLPKEEIDYKDDSNEVESCMVCLEEIEAGLVVSTLPCSHIFHSFCISEWLKKSHYCPICRFEMPIAQ